MASLRGVSFQLSNQRWLKSKVLRREKNLTPFNKGRQSMVNKLTEGKKRWPTETLETALLSQTSSSMSIGWPRPRNFPRQPPLLPRSTQSRTFTCISWTLRLCLEVLSFINDILMLSLTSLSQRHPDTRVPPLTTACAIKRKRSTSLGMAHEGSLKDKTIVWNVPRKPRLWSWGLEFSDQVTSLLPNKARAGAMI